MCDQGLEGQVICQQNILGMEPRGRQFVEIQNSPPLLPTHTNSGPNLNLGLGGFQSRQALGVPSEHCLPQFPSPGFIKPLLSYVRPLVEELDYELWALGQDSEDLGLTLT